MARYLKRIWSITRLEGDYIAYQTANNAEKRQITQDKRNLASSGRLSHRRRKQDMEAC
jgi:hypothetical protein